jgi:predicted DNA-binding transcriptional regulator AlpA
MGRAIQHPSATDLAALIPGTLLTVKEMAVFVKASTSTVWRQARQGRVPRPVRISAGMTRWKSNDVINWYANLTE